MATNDDGPGKGPGKGTTDPTGPKKPSAILDLKPTSVGMEDPAKQAPGTSSSAAPGASPAKPDDKAGAQQQSGSKPPETKASETKTPDTKPAGTYGTGSVPPVAAGIASAATTAAAAAAKTPPSSSATPGAAVKPGPAAKPGETPSPAETKPVAKNGPSAAASGATVASTAAKATPSAPAASKGGLLSVVTHLAAGLAGGLMVLLAGDAVGPQLGIDLRRNDTAQTRELEARLAAVETRTRAAIQPTVPADLDRRLAGVEQRAGDLDALRKRIGELEQRNEALAGAAKALEERLGAKTSDSTDARVAKLEDVLSTLQRAAGEQGGRIPQLAAITGRLSDLEATLNTQIAQLRKSLMQDVDARLTGASEASEAARNGTARIDRELATQKAETARIGQRVDGFRTQVDRVELAVRTAEETASGLRGAIETLRADLGKQLKDVARPADVASAVEPVSGRLETLQRSLQAVEKSEAERRASVERIVLSLELGNLKRAVERGAPFAAELSRVRNLAKTDLAALERYKDQGVTSLANLQRDFRDLSYRIIEADRSGDSAGIVDRLIAGAKSIVRVRKTDVAPDDNSVEAIVARMEAALREGRLTDVGAEAARLSEPARKVAASWLERVEANAAVDRAIATVEAELKSALGAAGKRG